MLREQSAKLDVLGFPTTILRSLRRLSTTATTSVGLADLSSEPLLTCVGVAQRSEPVQFWRGKENAAAQAQTTPTRDDPPHPPAAQVREHRPSPRARDKAGFELLSIDPAASDKRRQAAHRREHRRPSVHRAELDLRQAQEPGWDADAADGLVRRGVADVATSAVGKGRPPRPEGEAEDTAGRR